MELYALYWYGNAFAIKYLVFMDTLHILPKKKSHNIID